MLHHLVTEFGNLTYEIETALIISVPQLCLQLMRKLFYILGLLCSLDECICKEALDAVFDLAFSV